MQQQRVKHVLGDGSEANLSPSSSVRKWSSKVKEAMLQPVTTPLELMQHVVMAPRGQRQLYLRQAPGTWLAKA